MAVTKIWNIRGRADRPLEYVVDAEKTHREFSEADMQALQDVIAYEPVSILPEIPTLCPFLTYLLILSAVCPHTLHLMKSEPSSRFLLSTASVNLPSAVCVCGV